jgi:SWIM zinc finger
LGLSLQKIEQMAPDQGSLAAAKKLLKPSIWPSLQENGEGLLWGECQGSGATPYRIAVTEADAGYKCTCPSRKFPCKHSLALMWMRADNLAPFLVGTPPQWVNDWLGRRRGPTPGVAGAGAAAPKAAEPGADRPSIAAVVEDAAPVADAEAEARAEAQRARSRAQRESLIAAGISAMEQWIADQLERGLAGFDQRAAPDCAMLAKRLVDAKAGGLANRIAALPAALFRVPEDERPQIAARALAAAYLIGQAYARQDSLPELLKADVRQAVGWSLTREALLEDASLLRVDGLWRVLAVRDEVQPDRLRRIETWLRTDAAGGYCAALIDYIPVSGGATGNMYMPGEVLDAELVYYPSPVPLRAQIIAHRGTRAAMDRWAGADASLPDAVAVWRGALSRKPWLDAYPLAASQVRIRAAGARLYACAGDLALPLAAASDECARPLSTVDAISLFGLWDGRELTPLLAETPIGEWIAA